MNGLQELIAVLEYNPYHDARGRFTTAMGGHINPNDAKAVAFAKKRDEQELPKPPPAGKDERIKSWTDITGALHSGVTKIGQLIYAPSSVGSNAYAEVFHAKSGKGVSSWRNAPITGKVSIAKDRTRQMAALVNWDKWDSLSLKQRSKVGSEIMRLRNLG